MSAVSARYIDRFLRRFDARSIARGREYARDGRVLNIEKLGDKRYSAAVQGRANDPYLVSLYLTDQYAGIASSRCTCPVGLSCKHGAAVVFEIGKLLEESSGGGVQETPQHDRVQYLEPVPCLSLERLQARQHTFFAEKTVAPGEYLPVAVLSFEYAAEDGSHATDEDGQVVLRKHNTRAESQFAARLQKLGLHPLFWGTVNGQAFGKQYFRFFRSLQFVEFLAQQEILLKAGWQIAVDPELLPIPVDDIELILNDDTNGQEFWFSLSLELKVEGETISLLPILRSAISRIDRSAELGSDAVEDLNQDGYFWAPLRNGRLMKVPFERVRHIIQALYELLDRKQPLEEQEIKASVLNLAELAKRFHWQGFDRIRLLVDKLQQLTALTVCEPPAGFKTELRAYQLEGYSWLQSVAQLGLGGILADDMGLGKTVQLLAHILKEKESGRQTSPYLVVSPTTVLPNWQAEAERFAPGLKVVVLHGPDRAGRFEEAQSADLVLTTYPLVLRDGSALKKISWHGIALDEAQVIKNSRTRIAQTICTLKAGHRLCLTGTPVENNLAELWSQFNFFMPGLLGDLRSFKTNFQVPIEKFGDGIRRQILATRLRPFLLRRTKAQVAQELPEKTVIVTPVTLEDAQRDLYETVRVMTLKVIREAISRKGFEKSQIHILDALLKLRQVCCDPRLVKLPAARNVAQSAKLAVVVEMLHQLVEEKRKVLVFSQFTSMLDLIIGELDRMKIPFVEIRGETKDRKTPVDRFQKGDVQIFLLSLKAGGTGLNLTAADTVVHYDPWWNPAVEDQATDRAHRIGQLKNVFVYKIIAQGTIEERMVKLQEKKRVIAQAIYDGDRNSSITFTEQDLELLLAPIE